MTEAPNCFAEKNFLVTGAASGFGKLLSKRLVSLGGIVSILDVDQIGVEKMLRDAHCHFAAICDVSDPVSVENALQELFAKVHTFDGLVNNAGIIWSSPLVDIRKLGDTKFRRQSEDFWEKVISTNLSSVFYVTSIVAEKMVERRTKGVIVNIGSIASRGNAGQGAYAAAKAGVEALSNSWARELGPLGIRAVTVSPGYCDTGSTRAALSGENIARVVSEIPLRRLGLAEEVVQAVLFAISNNYISGRTISVDGGLPT